MEAAAEGRELDLTFRDEREIRAGVIRELLCGKETGDVDPCGVRLRGARVTDGLDLTDVRAEVPLVMRKCEHTEEVTLNRAHLPHLDLGDSQFPLLFGNGLVCEHGLWMRGVFAEKLLLSSADITDVLNLSNAKLATSEHPALFADGINVDGNILFREGFTASSGSDLGTIRLCGATITGQFDLRGAELAAASGPALDVDGATIGGQVFCDNGFTARSDSESGTLRLVGISVGGELSLTGAELIAANGPALYADRANISGDLFCRNGFTASSDSELGTIRLHGATIAGQFDLSGAELIAANGPAFAADRANISRDLFCCNGFTASSDSEAGTCRFPGGSIGGELSFTGAEIIALNGPALGADGANISGNLFFGGATVRSDSDLGTIRLPGASIAAQLSFRETAVLNTGADVALDMGNARVENHLFLPLSTFDDDPEFKVNLSGLRYPLIPRDVTWREWLDLLSRHTPSYAAQPYQQLAAVHREAGHEREARQILIAQQRDLRKRGEPGHRGQRLLHAASGLFIGYGHKPWRALGFLAWVCALAVGLLFTAHAFGIAVRPGPGNAPCSLAEVLGAAIDTSVPILKTGGGTRCEIAANTGLAQALYLGGYVVQAMGWAFATLFVAGYTGLIRRNT